METRIKNGLDRYANDRVPTGDFLRAVLENNLMEAIARADTENLRDLFEICSYVYNHIPSACHGSQAKVRNWLRRV